MTRMPLLFLAMAGLLVHARSPAAAQDLPPSGHLRIDILDADRYIGNPNERLPLPIRVKLVDPERSDAPVAGVPVELLSSDPGMHFRELSPGAGFTDRDGVAGVLCVLGPAGGTHTVTAACGQGSNRVTAEISIRARTPFLEASSVVHADGDALEGSGEWELSAVVRAAFPGQEDPVAVADARPEIRLECAGTAAEEDVHYRLHSVDPDSTGDGSWRWTVVPLHAGRWTARVAVHDYSEILQQTFRCEVAATVARSGIDPEVRTGSIIEGNGAIAAIGFPVTLRVRPGRLLDSSRVLQARVDRAGPVPVEWILLLEVIDPGEAGGQIEAAGKPPARSVSIRVPLHDDLSFRVHPGRPGTIHIRASVRVSSRVAAGGSREADPTAREAPTESAPTPGRDPDLVHREVVAVGAPWVRLVGRGAANGPSPAARIKTFAARELIDDDGRVHSPLDGEGAFRIECGAPDLGPTARIELRARDPFGEDVTPGLGRGRLTLSASRVWSCERYVLYRTDPIVSTDASLATPMSSPDPLDGLPGGEALIQGAAMGSLTVRWIPPDPAK